MRPTNTQWRGIALLVVVVIFAAALGFTLLSAVWQANNLCDFQQRSWKTQRLQIADDAKPQKPSEQVLRAFPQIRPFYDPKNPLYAEQIRILTEHADRKYRILGARPEC